MPNFFHHVDGRYHLARTQDLANSVNEAGRHSTQGLLVVMTFSNHQSPIDLGQAWIDPACRISREVERALDAVVA